jgi:short subunit dehydrogenase-like uncharacterized protein
MKKSTIKAGEVYQVKVSGKLTDVRIIGGNPHGGWDGINLATKKQVRIKSGARLRKPISQKAKEAVNEVENKTPATPQVETQTPETNATPTPKKERSKSKPSGLDLAAKILQEAGQPLNCQEIVKQLLDRGLWKTDGKTPAATIYSAIITEIKNKGVQSRFVKTERGKFIAAK